MEAVTGILMGCAVVNAVSNHGYHGGSSIGEIIHACLTAYTCLPPHLACSSAIQTSSAKVSAWNSR